MVQQAVLQQAVLFCCLLDATAWRVVSTSRGNRHRHAIGPLMSSSQELSTDELKAALLDSAKAFKAAQEEKWEAEDKTSVIADADDVAQVDERLSSPLKAEAFGNVELGYDEKLGALRNQTIALLEQLAERNPTPAPLADWKTADCMLDGTWRLLFTTGADATFRKTEGSGRPVTFQKIDARKGYFVNSVDFPTSSGKLKGFRVVVKVQASRESSARSWNSSRYGVGLRSD